MIARIEAQRRLIDRAEPSNKVNLILNFACAVGMIVAAVLRLIRYEGRGFHVDGFYFAFSMYLILFAVILAAAELELRLIAKYVEFLVSPLGKGVFLLFIGILMFDQSKDIDSIASIAISLIGLSNLVAALVK